MSKGWRWLGGCGGLALVTTVLGLGAIALCVGLPVGFWQYTTWQYCWFPPQDPTIEVVASACQTPILGSVSPDGRYVSYGSREKGVYHDWLLNTMTGEQLLDKCGGIWLTNTLRLGITAPGGSWAFSVCDTRDGSRTPVQWVEGLEGTTSRRDYDILVFSPQVAEWLRKAEMVYYIDEPWNVAVALAPDYQKHPQDNYALATPHDFRMGDEKAILPFLEENKIPYTSSLSENPRLDRSFGQNGAK